MYCELIAAHYFTILPANKQALARVEWKRPEPGAGSREPGVPGHSGMHITSCSAYQLSQCDKLHDKTNDMMMMLLPMMMMGLMARTVEFRQLSGS